MREEATQPVAKLGDSRAVREDRILPHHEAALTLLQDRLSDPTVASVRWLDLACGRGQIIASLEENLSDDARAKIDLVVCDADNTYLTQTSELAAVLGLASFQSKLCDLSDFHQLYDPAARFDFITFTNTVHEVAPSRLGAILVDLVIRLADEGALFIYDMEQPNPLELGAVPWTRDEMKQIVRSILNEFGATDYNPELGRWSHTKTSTWNVHLQRKYVKKSDDELLSRRAVAVNAASQSISSALQQKLDLCNRLLGSLVTRGANSAAEQAEKDRALHEFFAVTRALAEAQQ